MQLLYLCIISAVQNRYHRIRLLQGLLYINHTLVASLENCASFVPSYFIGRIPSDTLRKLIFYAIDVPELSWELRVLYRRDSALGIFAREMIRLVRETPWRPLL